MLEENKVIELNDEDLEKVSGGNGDGNPKGLRKGDKVFFYYDILDQCIWAEFVDYDEKHDKYKVKWDDTILVYGGGKAYLPIEADETSISPSCIKNY